MSHAEVDYEIRPDRQGGLCCFSLYTQDSSAKSLNFTVERLRRGKNDDFILC